MSTETSRDSGAGRIWLAFLVISGGALSAYLAGSIFDATVFLSGILCVGLIAIGRSEGYT